MVGRSNESGEGRPESGAGLSRRQFLAALVGGGAAVGAATYVGVRIFRDDGHDEGEAGSTPRPVELSAEATAAEKAEIIADALTAGRKVTGVDVAVDYEILYPQDGGLDHPDGIRSPFILGEGIYGYNVYNQDTGEVSVFITPEGGTLMEAPYGPAMEQSGQPEPNPHNATVDISPVYYESETAYGYSGRLYVTAIGQEPGPIPQELGVMRAGEPISAGE